MAIYGYELVGDWENSTCGKIATSTKGGKRYFLKKFQTPVAPIDNGTLDAKTFAHNKKMFEDFVNLRKTVNTRIRPIAGPGGNIIIPCEEFIDGNQYVEVSEFVEGAIPKRELVGILASLSIETKKLLMKTAAGALSSVHSKHVVHSDLKLENLLLVRNSAGNYVAKMLDFDSSYPVDNKPEEIIGTIDYYSPELGRYVDSEDEEEEEELKKYITEKTDIFSLGLIYHFYLAGEFPEAVSLTDKLKKRKEKGKVIYPWIALNSGCELQISPSIKGIKYISLISDMLSINPDDRPTALEVLKRLQAPETSDSAPMIEEPFPEHNIKFDKDAVKAAGVAKISKHMAGSEKKYSVLYNSGKKETLSKDDIIAKGYAKTAVVSWPESWPEHALVFEKEKLMTRGFVGGEQTIHGGVKGYKFFRPDGTETFFRVETLLGMRYAKRTGSAPVTTTGTTSPTPAPVPPTTPGGFADPWEEHKIEFDIDTIKAKGYVSSSQQIKNGVKGYEFVRSNGVRQFIVVDMVVILKLAKKI